MIKLIIQFYNILKSQGKTFDRIHIDLESGAFAEGPLCVALSICKSLEGLTLAHQSMWMIFI